MSINTLQEKINITAKRKLEADFENSIKGLRELLSRHNQGYAKLQDIIPQINSKNPQPNIYGLLEWFEQEYKLKSLPTYVDRETQDFITRVKDLEEEVAELRNKIDN